VASLGTPVEAEGVVRTVIGVGHDAWCRAVFAEGDRESLDVADAGKDLALSEA
jgi:hypothetical protein